MMMARVLRSELIEAVSETEMEIPVKDAPIRLPEGACARVWEEDQMKKLTTLLEYEQVTHEQDRAIASKSRLPSCVSAVAMLLALPCMARADVMITGPETLAQAILNEVEGLSGLAGPDLSLNLQYDVAVDTTSGLFSYSTLPGQTYNGLSFSVSGAGTYDSTTTTYDWTASGQLGPDSLLEQGEEQWSGDPSGQISGTIALGGNDANIFGPKETIGNADPKTGDRMSSGMVTITVGASSLAGMEMDILHPNGKVEGTAQIRGHGPNFPFTGTYKEEGKLFKISSVPEPSYALLLAAIIVFGLSNYAWRRKKKQRRTAA